METKYKTIYKTIKANSLKEFNDKTNELVKDGYYISISFAVLGFIKKTYIQQFYKVVKDE